MKRDVMTLAHALRKSGLRFADALKRAWYALKLKARMMRGNVSFFYTKEDGSERFALGSYAQAPARDNTGTARKPNPLVLVYFDLFTNDWRSCRIDRLILD